MILKFYEMNCVLANIFVDLMYKNDLPVSVNVGRPYIEGNNERMVSVNCSFKQVHRGVFDKYLGLAMAEAADILSGGRMAI